MDISAGYIVIYAFVGSVVVGFLVRSLILGILSGTGGALLLLLFGSNWGPANSNEVIAWKVLISVGMVFIYLPLSWGGTALGIRLRKQFSSKK